MTDNKPNDPLHGITLERILTQLVERYGWETLGRLIDIRCFQNCPSIKSSLQFLRKTPWARTKVERLYLKRIASSPLPGKENGMKLTGAPKQVVWAEKVRKDRLKVWKETSPEIFKAIESVLTRERRADWWIAYKDKGLEVVCNHLMKVARER